MCRRTLIYYSRILFLDCSYNRHRISMNDHSSRLEKIPLCKLLVDVDAYPRLQRARRSTVGTRSKWPLHPHTRGLRAAPTSVGGSFFRWLLLIFDISTFRCVCLEIFSGLFLSNSHIWSKACRLGLSVSQL